MAKCKLVAEIGINHNGDLILAKKMIKLAKDCGFDFVKFQKRNCDILVPEEKKQIPKETPWGIMPYIEYKKRLEFLIEEYIVINAYCEYVGIKWFGSPWDVDSVKFLNKFNCEYVKIASACITDFKLLKAIKKSNKLIILATGMSTQKEVKNAMNIVGDNVEYILACTSTYPTLPKEMNLHFIKTLQKEYPDYSIGFSNHNPGILFAASSILYGAEMIEVHITLDRSMFGSDQAASIEESGMRKLVRYVKDLEEAKGNGEWTVFDSEEKCKNNLRRF